MKRLIIVALISLFAAGCCSVIGGNRVCVNPPEPRPTTTATSTQVPAVTPTPTPFGSSPTASPTTTVQPPPPTPRWLPTVPSTCNKTVPSVYNNQVRSAIAEFQASHPELFDGNVLKYCAPGYTCPISQDVLLYGIADILWNTHGLDGMIDPCMCGDFIVADHNTLLGAGFAEGYHPISSQRIVQSAPYIEQCVPRWLQYAPTAAATPTFTPPPTPVPTRVAACPPLLTITSAKLANGKFVGPSGTCQIMDFTPRFYIDGKDMPCNKEKWANCGVAGGGVDAAGNHIEGGGDSCEPRPNDVLINIVSETGPAHATKDYGGRACGNDGSPFTSTAVPFEKEISDKAGRPVDLSKFSPILFNGNI